MSEYNRELLTEREKEYFDCQIESESSSPSALTLIGNIVMSFFAAVLRALFVPSSDYSKADRRLLYNLRLRKYAKYKAAVMRKAQGESAKGDDKILIKLNRKEFVLSEDLFDPDEYTQKVYDDYMSSHPELFDDEKE